MSSAEDLGAYYQEWWENPHDPRNVVFDKLNRLVRERIPPGQGKKALDLGAGKGTIVSYLVEKGYDVTAVELHPAFAQGIRHRFPGVRVVNQDIRQFQPEEEYDLVTCIELVQNISPEETGTLVKRLRPCARSLFINISNETSLHGLWVRSRGFRASFVFPYRTGDLEQALDQGGFSVSYRQGVGALTPITMFRGFKGNLLPRSVCRAANGLLDPLLTRYCHLYYVEAR